MHDADDSDRRATLLAELISVYATGCQILVFLTVVCLHTTMSVT